MNIRYSDNVPRELQGNQTTWGLVGNSSRPAYYVINTNGKKQAIELINDCWYILSWARGSWNAREDLALADGEYGTRRQLLTQLGPSWEAPRTPTDTIPPPPPETAIEQAPIEPSTFSFRTTFEPIEVDPPEESSRPTTPSSGQQTPSQPLTTLPAMARDPLEEFISMATQELATLQGTHPLIVETSETPILTSIFAAANVPTSIPAAGVQPTGAYTLTRPSIIASMGSTAPPPAGGQSQANVTVGGGGAPPAASNGGMK